MLQEIDINKLVPNDYNPPSRGERNTESLSKSLGRDGQIDTIAVRAIDGGKFEIVDGTRRYEAAKAARLKMMLCNVLDLTYEEAQDYNYIANREREAETAMDEAWRFFRRLGLSDKQLFQEAERERDEKGHYKPVPANAHLGLPSWEHPDVHALAKRLGIKADRIGRRLPLMALPNDLASLIDLQDSDPKKMPIGVAQEIARLRLIGNKEEAHKLMKDIWRKWGRATVDEINRHVTDIIKTYQQESDKLLKELKTIEDNLDNRIIELNRWVDDDMGSWFNPDIKNNIWKDLPEELRKDGIEVPEFKPRDEKENPGKYARKIYDMSDELTMSITSNDALETMKDDIDLKVDKLSIGLRELKDDTCVFCGHLAKKKEIEGKINLLSDDLTEFEEKLNQKDAARGRVEKLKRELGTLIRKYDNVVDKYRASLDKLLKSDNISKEVYLEKTSKYRLEE